MTGPPLLAGCDEASGAVRRRLMNNSFAVSCFRGHFLEAFQDGFNELMQGSAKGRLLAVFKDRTTQIPTFDDRRVKG